MVSGRCSASSGSRCSSFMHPPWTAAMDRMVEEEIEAAEALADLAHFAMREQGGPAADSGGGKRVEIELPPPAESVPRCSDLAQERITSPKEPARECRNMLVEPLKAYDRSEKILKVEKETEPPRTGVIASTGSGCFLLGIGRSRRNLTEGEKEARRIRRILANRESARQTIRRREALCEELTKKATDLALENEGLKREMDMVLKEYRRLETTNKRLKEEMAKVVKADVEEIPGAQEPACVPITPSSASPLFLYHHLPFTPMFWPPVSQFPSSVQASHMPQNAIVMPSNIPFPAEGRHDSCEQENLMNANRPRTHFYIFPCPWFFLHPDPGTSLQSQTSNFQTNGQDETSTNNQHSPTLSRTTPHQESQHSFVHIKVKTELPGSLEARTTNDINEHQREVGQDGGDQHIVSNLKGRISKEVLVTPRPMKPVVVPSTTKHEGGVPLNSTPHIKASAEVYHAPPSTAPPEKYREPIIYSCKKLAEAVAAAEARKRRKELTKLKSSHGRQCRMHC